jgi:hypothetical protein
MLPLGLALNHHPGRLQSDTIAVLDYGATGEKHFTIPTGATVAVVQASVACWLLTNGQTAAVPTGDGTSFPSPNTVPELIQANRVYYFGVTAGNLFSCAASAAGFVSVAFYEEHV